MSVEVIDKIKPKNNGNFPLVDADDVEMPDGSRLADHDFLESSKLPDAVNQALAQAKASGEFNGKDGYTPQKNVDYFDGKDGVDGKNGVDGKDGQNGKDGADGKTPVKGEDYYTKEDKQEIISEVLRQIEIPESPSTPGGSVELPVFDLASLGMAPIILPASYSVVQTDATAIMAALSKGSVQFVIPIDMGGAAIPVYVTMQGIALGTSYQCISLFTLGTVSALVVNIDSGSVTVMVSPVAETVGLPAASEADNNKIMQVVNGKWEKVEVKNSSVATYVDDYISSALEGDY